jgi:hypothetical protein
MRWTGKINKMKEITRREMSTGKIRQKGRWEKTKRIARESIAKR